MKARCPECSAVYDVPETERPRRARCRCGATFLLAPMEPFGEPVAEPVLEALPERPVEATAERTAARSVRPPAGPLSPPRHSVKPTRRISGATTAIGATMAVFTFVWGLLARLGVVAAAGDWGGGRGAADAALFSAAMLVITVPTVVAAVGLILNQPWGWWFAVVIQGGALLLSGRFLWSYLSRLNWDHPKAEDVVVSASLAYGIPFLAAFALLTALFLPGVRLACGVKSRPLPARRRRVAGRPPGDR